MIIIGYQGIGKSTLGGSNRFIDLESGNMWVNGKRVNDWYIPYCNIAIHLSNQGFFVFTSSHEVVRNYLKENTKEDVIIICPAVELKYEWIAKLQARYDETQLEKDYKALMNAKDRYEDNITELLNSGIHCIEIKSMDYNLSDIISEYNIIHNYQ